METMYFEVVSIDGDYANLKRTDAPSDDLRVVARADVYKRQHFHSIVGSTACYTTVPVLEHDNESSVIPGKKLIFDIESKDTCRFIRVDGIFSKKLLDIDNSSHSIRSDSFLYITVIKLKGYRFAVIVVTTYFINHRIVGMYIFPQSKLGFTV